MSSGLRLSMRAARVAVRALAPLTPLASVLLPAVARAQASTPAVDSVAFVGEVRTRAEADRPGAGAPGDAFTLLRTRLGVRARVGGNARAFVQIQDSRTFGEERSTIDGAADALDLHQGWVELDGRWRDGTIALRAGRQELSLGNERLVGAVGWSNVGRSVDGARVDLVRPGGADAWRITGFAATLQERGPHLVARTADTPAMPDDVLAGLYATNGSLEALVVHDRMARVRAYTDVRRTTAYGRLRTPAPGALSLDVEAAWQLGTQSRAADGATGAVAQDVGAWFVGARVVRAGAGRVPTLTLGADVLSGDADPADDTYGAFNTLYATNHKWYGFMDLFLDPTTHARDRGLVDAIAGVGIPLGPRAKARADLHGFWTATGRAPSAGGPTSDDARALGWELDLALPVRVNATSELELGYALFRAGDGAAALGFGAAGTTRQWGYAQLRVGF